jgi:hypothetical protein
VAIDPGSEIITVTQVTPGNAADNSVADKLLVEVLPSVADPGIGRACNLERVRRGCERAIAVGLWLRGRGRRAAPLCVEAADEASAVGVFGDSSYGNGGAHREDRAAGARGQREGAIKLSPPVDCAAQLGSSMLRAAAVRSSVPCLAAKLVGLLKPLRRATRWSRVPAPLSLRGSRPTVFPVPEIGSQVAGLLPDRRARSPPRRSHPLARARSPSPPATVPRPSPSACRWCSGAASHPSLRCAACGDGHAPFVATRYRLFSSGNMGMILGDQPARWRASGSASAAGLDRRASALRVLQVGQESFRSGYR